MIREIHVAQLAQPDDKVLITDGDHEGEVGVVEHCYPDPHHPSAYGVRLSDGKAVRVSTHEIELVAQLVVLNSLGKDDWFLVTHNGKILHRGTYAELETFCLNIKHNFSHIQVSIIDPEGIHAPTEQHPSTLKGFISAPAKDSILNNILRYGTDGFKNLIKTHQDFVHQRRGTLTNWKKAFGSTKRKAK